MDQELPDPAPQPAPEVVALEPLTRLSALLDSLSFAFFYLSFSGLTQLLTSWWCRFSAED